MAPLVVSPEAASFTHISTKSVRAAMAQKGSALPPSLGIRAAAAEM
jgi:hypothetical protein